MHWPDPAQHNRIVDIRGNLQAQSQRPNAKAGSAEVEGLQVSLAGANDKLSAGLAQYAIPVRHFVLHADQDTLRGRIKREHPVPSPFRLKYLEPYAEAART